MRKCVLARALLVRGACMYNQHVIIFHNAGCWFAYRRNDPLVIAELHAYCAARDEYEKRMPMWVKNKHNECAFVDSQRSVDQGIDDGSRFPFQTYYRCRGEEIPTPAKCSHGTYSICQTSHEHHVHTVLMLAL